VPDKIIELAPAGMPGPLYVNSAKPELGSPPVIVIVLQVPRVAPLEERRVVPEQVVSEGVAMKNPTG